ncbi:LysR substrate-binding domain-containing protein [Streptomyces xiamenensis]
MPLPRRVSDLAPFELLLSVARLGSLGAAAREHGISQPAASSRIRQLERRLGLGLLERSPRGSRLTPEGALVADWARTATDAAAVLEAGIGSLARAERARLPVAASLTVAEYLLPHWLARFRAVARDTAVSLTTGNSDDVARAVRSGTARLGFVEGPEDPAGLVSRTVARDTLTVIVPPGHPWTRYGADGVPAQELAATPLIARESGSGTRQHLDRALHRHTGAGPVPPLLELSSTTAIKTAVGEGVGPAVLSSLATARDAAAGAVVPLPVRGLDLTRRLRAVHRPDRPPGDAARTLLACARPVPRQRTGAEG